MASMPLVSFRPSVGIRAAAAPEDAGMRKGPSSRRPSGANWWGPIFGWGGTPDYITGSPSQSSSSPASADNKRGGDEDGAGRGGGGGGTARATVSGARAAPTPVVFTEEKARLLRMKTAEAANFHDIMYHSAIASRLASDFQGHGQAQGQGQRQVHGHGARSGP